MMGVSTTTSTLQQMEPSESDRPLSGPAGLVSHFRPPHDHVSHFRPPHDHVHTLHDNWQAAVAAHPHTPALGWRSRTADGQLGHYEWITYQQAGDIRAALGSGLLHLGISPGSALGLYGINSKDWVLLDAAAHAYSMVTVPLYDTLGPDTVEYVCNHAELAAVGCSAAALPKLLACLPRSSTVRLVVVWGTQQQAAGAIASERLAQKQSAALAGAGQQMGSVHDLRQAVQQAAPVQQAAVAKLDTQQQQVLRHQKSDQLPAGCQLITFEQLECLGRQHPHPHVAPGPADVALICYTSGTTGLPKGVVLTHANLIANAAGNAEISLAWPAGSRHISYLPLAHIFERKNIMMAVHYACSIGFYSGTVAGLLDDVAELQPHMFMSVPRVYNKLHDAVMAAVNSAGPQQQQLFHAAFEHRKAALQAGGGTAGGLLDEMFDQLMFNSIRQKLGGQVQYMTTGASPISSEVLEFLRVCFGCAVVEGYGMTETSCTISIQRPDDVSSGHVGVPLPCCQVKLVDVPELDYLTTDKPHPRGEVCVRGPVIFQGYHKDPHETHQVVDDDGWFHTGDVGCWLQGGNLKIIDRKKNIFKLAQGEYVAPEKLEAVYTRSPFVQQCFVHGDSCKSQLVAVVVPDPDYLQPWAKQQQQQLPQDLAALCSRPDVSHAVLQSMRHQGQLAQLQGFEMVAAVQLVAQPFTVDSGLMTPTMKLRRQAARVYFGEILEGMYVTLQQQQQQRAGVLAARAQANVEWTPTRARL